MVNPQQLTKQIQYDNKCPSRTLKRFNNYIKLVYFSQIRKENVNMKTLLLPFLFLYISCNGQTKPDENFYFPINTFFIEKTYCFVNQNDTTEKAYWKMMTKVSNGDSLLQTSVYDTKNRITEIMSEKVLNGNSKINTYTLFSYDQQGKKLSSKCKVLDSLVFKSVQKISEEIQWRVNFKDFNSPSNCELTKIRILNANTSNQKTFTDLMRFEVLDTKQGYQYHMVSVYQRHKGLVSYKLILPGGKVKDFVLIGIK
jgi:hypothetical protein